MSGRWDVSFGDLLNARENHVLLALADGLSNTEIAGELGLGVETVKVNMATLLEKLGARNRTHAVALAYHLGLLVPKKAA